MVQHITETEFLPELLEEEITERVKEMEEKLFWVPKNENIVKVSLVNPELNSNKKSLTIKDGIDGMTRRFKLYLDEHRASIKISDVDNEKLKLVKHPELKLFNREPLDVTSIKIRDLYTTDERIRQGVKTELISIVHTICVLVQLAKDYYFIDHGRIILEILRAFSCELYPMPVEYAYEDMEVLFSIATITRNLYYNFMLRKVIFPKTNPEHSEKIIESIISNKDYHTEYPVCIAPTLAPLTSPDISTALLTKCRAEHLASDQIYDTLVILTVMILNFYVKGWFFPLDNQ